MDIAGLLVVGSNVGDVLVVVRVVALGLGHG